VSRVPIRVRMAALLALAMLLVLAAAGLFVYLRLASDLDESLDASLEARAAAVATSGQAAAGSAGDGEDGFAQLLSFDGRVLSHTGSGGAAVLTASELARAVAGGEVHAERPVPGVDGTARLLGVTRGRRIAVVAQTLDDRNETLSALAGSFAIGGPLAVLLVSLLGYGLATAGLRPVEAMRRRAERVSLERDGERLPLPAARDEIRRLGETLNEMLDRLRRSYEHERRFVADASHELRTPVAVIKTELEGALRREPEDPELREALAAAVDECDRLAQLAEDLLVVARAGDGALPVRPRALDAAELLEGVRLRFAARAREHGRAIEVDAAEGLQLRGDDLRLGQALGNLVDNALRHGGGEIRLRARAAGDAVLLEVSDDGPGFAPQLTGRAFERFARGDEARTRGGAGLGLAIVRAIAEAHGGSAELAGGATVRIRLPAQRDLSARPYAGRMQGHPGERDD
jgi:two-component system, OmpR family, sensor kinase